MENNQEISKDLESNKKEEETQQNGLVSDSNEIVSESIADQSINNQTLFDFPQVKTEIINILK